MQLKHPKPQKYINKISVTPLAKIAPTQTFLFQNNAQDSLSPFSLEAYLMRLACSHREFELGLYYVPTVSHYTGMLRSGWS